jgi:hypothetical protein
LLPSMMSRRKARVATRKYTAAQNNGKDLGYPTTAMASSVQHQVSMSNRLRKILPS